MATIDLRRTHSLGKAKAREAAEGVAQRLKEKIQIEYRWDGDDLRFERSGAKGRIHVSDNEVRVEVDLGLMLKPMKGMITEKIQGYLDRSLASA